MAADNLRTQVWLLKGITGSAEGTLRLADGRLSFTADEGHQLFDVPLSEVSGVKFPWYYFGGGVKLRIGANKYRLSFVQPGNTANSSFSDIGGGRRAGKAWKSALASRM